MTTTWFDLVITLALSFITHSAAFFIGAMWHHWYRDVERAKNAAGTEGRP